MTLSDARYYVKQELSDRFGKVFRRPRQYSGRCSRDSRTQVRCRTSLRNGKYLYTGTVVVFYIVQNRTVYWDWRLRIMRVNASCEAARPRHRSPTRIYT
jgi:hypothetical protein